MPQEAPIAISKFRHYEAEAHEDTLRKRGGQSSRHRICEYLLDTGYILQVSAWTDAGEAALDAQYGKENRVKRHLPSDPAVAPIGQSLP